MKKSTIIATAAALFAAGAIVSGASAQSTNRCAGVNACKGQGWVHTGTTLECTAIGGRPQT